MVRFLCFYVRPHPEERALRARLEGSPCFGSFTLNLWFETAQAPPHHEGFVLLPPCQLLCLLPEHVLARLVVERLFLKLADCKPRLHLRPRADLGIPALDVRIIVERKPLRLVGHGPGKA